MSRSVAVVDLAYGDSGKGVVVDRLAVTGRYTGVVRANGGCQAAHNVCQDDGRHHTFAQFGSASFHGIRTFLSRHVLVEPLSMLNEAHALKQVGVDPWPLLHVDPKARVTTPYHWLVNRVEEDRRGKSRHGSCGRGIGTTVEHSLDWPSQVVHFMDIWNEGRLWSLLHGLRQWAAHRLGDDKGLPTVESLLPEYARFRQECRHFADMQLWWVFANQGPLIFEGAQGVLLDEWVGFHPHTTWSTTTDANARELAREAGIELEVMGVIRAYGTRHGAGPFPTEDASLRLPENHNKREHYQGAWRVGHQDVAALRYAIDACEGVDALYVTHADSASREKNLAVGIGYEGLELVRHPRENYAARELQTLALTDARPVLVDRHRSGWGATFSDLLDVELAGVGAGPKTRDGKFIPRLSRVRT